MCAELGDFQQVTGGRNDAVWPLRCGHKMEVEVASEAGSQGRLKLAGKVDVIVSYKIPGNMHRTIPKPLHMDFWQEL